MNPVVVGDDGYAEALASFDAEQGAWVAEAGEFEIRVGASSQDIRQRTPLRLLEN